MKNSYRHGDLANALVYDALDFLRENPAEDLSLRELAERAGVSPRAPYVHFPSKQHLLKAIAAKGFAELTKRSIKAGFDLDQLGEVYIEFAVENPHLFRLMFGGVSLTQDECEEIDGSFSHLVNAILNHHPDLSETEAKAGGLALWAFVHGLADLTIQQMAPRVELSQLRPILARVLDR